MTVPPLEEQEVHLTDGTEVLYRQLTEPLYDPAMKQPSSHAFGPKTADQGKPSFARSSVVTAQESRDWHTDNAAKPSLAVWGCTVGAVDDQEVRAVDDSGTPGTKSPGHAYVDYRGLSKPEEKAVRSALLAEALRLGEFPTTG
jgi:hypothetical protein